MAPSLPLPSTAESDDDTDDLAARSLFKEPEGYFRPEKAPSVAEYELHDGRVLKLGLVGESPLWGHVLWNASCVTAVYLQENASTLIKGKDVLELGAGAGLPGIVCGIEGARRVVITDYPDPPLIENLKQNIAESQRLYPGGSEVVAEGYLWGSSPPPSFSPTTATTNGAAFPSPSFDLLILSDLLFNHSEHYALLSTLRTFLRKPTASPSDPSHPRALIFFTPHRPHLLEKDLAFFGLIEQAGGMRVKKVLERDMGAPMFEEDAEKDRGAGDEKLRRMVFGWEVRWEEGDARGRKK